MKRLPMSTVLFVCLSVSDALTAQTFDYFRLFYAERQEREHFALMLLDSQHKVLECSVIFSGTIDGASI